MYTIKIFATIGNILFMIVLFLFYLNLRETSTGDKMTVRLNWFFTILTLANIAVAWIC